MAKVHGIVYLIIGIFVAIASYKINYDKLYPFFYIGLLFIVYGVAKIIIRFINRKENKSSITSQQRSLSQKNQQQRKYQAQQFKRCNTCGNVSRVYDNFCSRCGARLI